MRTAAVGTGEDPWYLAAEGARGSVDPSEAIRVCERVGEELDVHVVVVRAGVVAGFVHVAMAAEHAVRAWSRGNRISKHLEVELTLYLLGTREIRKALRTCRPSGEELVIIALGKDPENPGRAVESVVSRLGLKPDDSLLTPDPARASSVASELGIEARLVETADKGDRARAVEHLAASRAVLLALS